MRVLELFSGIGGMHYALRESKVPGEIVAAVDINTIANQVYKENFTSTNLIQGNIQGLSLETIKSLKPNIILMSPPCQPFTRVGLKKDIADVRTDALMYILSLLPKFGIDLQYILLENVMGFETSDSCSRLLDVIKEEGFIYQQFLLSPLQFSIPNSRKRYYLIGKRKPLKFVIDTHPDVVSKTVVLLFLFNLHLDGVYEPAAVKPIGKVLEFDDTDEIKYNTYLVPDKILGRRAKILDIVTKDSLRSCCFTKAYTHYAEGTGSVYCPYSEESIRKCYQEAEKYSLGTVEYVEALKELRLRYFTPKEVSRLMCFPEDFQFPAGVTEKQKYRLLGNSINVKVVAVLINLLCSAREYNEMGKSL
ncbi:hypothetical protein AAG570_012006 [Ranatra chinensis]|uniref:tRNA (cytosine(38)-C(5))-methyltransferase n=1 Tax=Ranatra chinensis TaxID=642074 RepID=A0ABD0YHR6_9HEMI